MTPHFGFEENTRIPIQTQLTWGYYDEPQNYTQAAISTERIDMALTVGPALFKVFHTSDFSVGFGVDQDIYGTGDLKANVTQDLALTTPIGKHFINAITYDEQNPIGPPDVPFELLDRLRADRTRRRTSCAFTTPTSTRCRCRPARSSTAKRSPGSIS